LALLNPIAKITFAEIIDPIAPISSGINRRIWIAIIAQVNRF
jgi:hypothetical protein